MVFAGFRDFLLGRYSFFGGLDLLLVANAVLCWQHIRSSSEPVMNVSAIAAACQRLASAVVRLQHVGQSESPSGTVDRSTSRNTFRVVPDLCETRSKAYLVDLEKIESAKFARRLW